jgi:plasmid stability protein
MATITVRNLPDEVHRAIRVRAALNGRSTEAEIRDILAKAAQPDGRVKLGAVLSAIGADAHLTEAEAAVFDEVRAPAPAEPVRWE